MAVTHWYLLLLLGVVIQRFVELAIARRNSLTSFQQGGREYGASHYPIMVALHTCFLTGCALEVMYLDRGFHPILGPTAFFVTLLCQVGRVWIIRSLGPQWNTRVIVVPGARAVTHGPYRYLKHPNYVVVALEGIFIPLICNAYITAIVFTVLNAGLMVVRIRIENRALQTLSSQ